MASLEHFAPPSQYICAISRLSSARSTNTHARTLAAPTRSGSGMSQDSDKGAGGTYSSWPSGAVADPPVAAGGAMTVGIMLTVAGALTVFVLFALAVLLLQYFFDDQGRRADGTAPPPTSGSRRLGGTAAGNGVGTRTRGVDPEVLRSLPVTVYRAMAGSEEEAVECAVCLAELEDGEEARFLPLCGHGFHAECVDMWLASHSTCPLCRLTVAKPDVTPVPALDLALPPLPPEPANHAMNLPAHVLLGVSDQGAVTAVTMASDGVTSPSAGTTAVLVIEIPEPAAPTPRDAAKSPGSARLRSIRRLWSFGRQEAGPSSSCFCGGGGGGEGADVEQGISVTIGIAVADVPLQSEAAAGASRRAAS